MSIKKRWTFQLAFLLMLGLFSGLVLQAAEKEPDKKTDAPPAVPEDPADTALEHLNMVNLLIAYGRENQNPEALILGARILFELRDADVKDEAAKEALADLNSLLEEARSLAPKSKRIVDQIEAAREEMTERPRGPKGSKTPHKNPQHPQGAKVSVKVATTIKIILKAKETKPLPAKKLGVRASGPVHVTGDKYPPKVAPTHKVSAPSNNLKVTNQTNITVIVVVDIF